MAVSVKLEPISRDIAVFLDDIAPKGRNIAPFARALIQEAKDQNRRVLGVEPPSKTFVDGRLGAPLESVNPISGTIVVEFELVGDVLRYIGEQLVIHSPHLTGRYERSHKLFADGIEVEPSSVLTTFADEWVFINTQPYARKIERGSSSDAPDGVYQAVAVLARRRFGNIAKIGFTYRGIIGGVSAGGRAGNRSENRNPAITVKLGR